MTLTDFHAVKCWYTHHDGHTVERCTWDAVLTVWLMGWGGLPVAMLLDIGWALPLGAAVLFLPGAYVGWRVRLHRRGRLRCDWIGAVRR